LRELAEGFGGRLAAIHRGAEEDAETLKIKGLPADRGAMREQLVAAIAGAVGALGRPVAGGVARLAGVRFALLPGRWRRRRAPVHLSP